MDIKAISLNVCGLRAPGKLNKIRSLIKKENCNLLGIQESKCDAVKVELIRYMWVNNQFDFVYKKSSGLAGGLILVWNSGFFSKEIYFEGANFCGVDGNWMGIDKKWVS